MFYLLKTTNKDDGWTVTSSTSSSGLSTTQMIKWANGAFLFFFKKTKQNETNMLKQFKYDHLESKMLYQDDSDPEYDNKKRDSSSNSKIEH